MINKIHTKILLRRLKRAEKALAEALNPFSPEVREAIKADPEGALKRIEKQLTWTKDDEFMANAEYIRHQM